MWSVERGACWFGRRCPLALAVIGECVSRERPLAAGGRVDLGDVDVGEHVYQRRASRWIGFL